jgi:hypothetical protein
MIDATATADPGDRAMRAAVCFYVLLGVTQHVTEGHFHTTWLPIYFAGFVAWVALAARAPAAPRRAPPDADLALLALCAAGAWFWSSHALLADARRGPALTLFRQLPWAVIALCGVAAWRRRAWWPVAGALAVVIGAKTLLLETSPRPFIDVFTSNTLAADFYLARVNPYAQVYPDIYGGGHDYRPGMVYWPAVLAVQSAARAAFGDIRWSFVLADLVTAGAVVAALARLGLTLRLALLAALALLLSPVGPFVFEQGWVDPLLFGAFALFAWAMAFEGAVLAGCALGLAVALKQYGAFGAAVGLAWALRAFGPRRAAQAAGAAALTFALTTLPVALQRFDAFVEMTVRVPGRMGLRRDALSLLVYLADQLTGAQPTTVTLLAAALSTGLGVIWVLRTARPTLAHWSAATGLAYGGFFFFGKQAFCNYHHFLGGFVLLHGAALLAEAPTLAAPERHESAVTPEEPAPREARRARRRRGR